MGIVSNGIENGATVTLASGVSGGSAATARTALGEGRSGAVAASADQGESTPRVSVSAYAAQAAQLDSAISNAPSVSQQRVEAIRAALAAGSYRIDPQRIASGLMQSDQLLASSTSQDV